MDQQSSNLTEQNQSADRYPLSARLLSTLITAFIVLVLGLICLTLT